MHDDIHGAIAGRSHVFGTDPAHATGELPAEATTLHGSVTGYLQIPLGSSITVDGVLEEAVIVGDGVMRVAGLLTEVYTATGVTLVASPGSAIAPVRSDGYWHVLQEDGTWSRSAQAVFPSASAEGPWYPVPDVLTD